MGWLSGVASVVAPVAASILDYKGAKDARAANYRMMEDQMGFQRSMSNTMHQREVEDMKAAGLNPILSAGAGASTPSGGVIPAQNVFEGAGASARDIVRLRQEAKTIDQNLRESASRIDSNRAAQLASISSARKLNAEASIAEAEVPLVRERVETDRKWLPVDSWLRRIGLIGGTARDAAFTYRGIKGFESSQESFDSKGTHQGTKIFKRR